MVDLERRLEDHEFARHWRLVRKLRREAHHLDLTGVGVSALLFGITDGTFVVDRDLSDEELDVAADWCAMQLWDGVPAFRLLHRAELDFVLSSWRANDELDQLAAWARDGTPLVGRLVRSC